MEVQMFNGWYFFWLILSVGSVVGLYFLLKNRTAKTQKIVLFSILVFGLVLHFLKAFIPPYSLDESRMLRDSWFINICGANIALFPFIFLSKSKTAKDYMFYLGILGGALAVLYPIEPIEKANQAAEWLDIVRFYIHHTELYAVPLLMVLFKLHKLDYRRCIFTPIWFLGVMAFIMVNQLLQSELGFIPPRNSDFFNINYKNSSMIWGPSGAIGDILAIFCPNFFKTVPFGEHAGETKYWPLLWLLFPVFILVTPLCFLLCMIFDWRHFGQDINKLLLFLHIKKEKGPSEKADKIIEDVLKSNLKIDKKR
ncbi:MAG: hypothetical protein ACI4R8_00295 [Candidatus Caccovivens sp.]